MVVVMLMSVILIAMLCTVAYTLAVYALPGSGLIACSVFMVLVRIKPET